MPVMGSERDPGRTGVKRAPSARVTRVGSPAGRDASIGRRHRANGRVPDPAPSPGEPEPGGAVLRASPAPTSAIDRDRRTEGVESERAGAVGRHP